MKSELKLLVAAFRSAKENSEKAGTPPSPPAGTGSVPMDGGWVWVWSCACCCSVSGCVSVRNED